MGIKLKITVIETIRTILGALVWLAFLGFLIYLGYSILYNAFKTLKSLFPGKREEKFSLSEEIRKFRKRKGLDRRSPSREELARSYILTAISCADIETVDRIVRDIKWEMEKRKQEEDRWWDEWSKKRRESVDDVGWYTTIIDP